MIEYRDNQWSLGPATAGKATAARIPAFLPDWELPERGPGHALVAIAEHYFAVLAKRLAQAPVKAQLAMLELLGVRPIASQPARCPVVLELPPGNGHSQIPARSQLSAQPTEASEPLIFETISQIGLADSRLVEMKTILPGDYFTDHIEDVLGEKPFTLFDHRQAIPRELYLAHDQIFAVSPGSVIELQIEVALGDVQFISHHAVIRWEYWDGDGWSAFAPFPEANANQEPVKSKNDREYSEDSTSHLTRSGIIRLRSSGKPADKTIVRGIQSYWIRGRLNQQGKFNFPHIDRIRVSHQSEVTGFQELKQKEELQQDNLAKLIVTLTDQSGALLDKSFGYVLNYKTDPREGTPRLVTANDDLKYVIKNEQNASVHYLQVQWKPRNGEPPRRSSWIAIEPPNRTRDYQVSLARAGLNLEMAFAAGLNADVTAPFQPFGPQPQQGTQFLFTCPELFSKPGAKVTAWIEATLNSPSDKPLAETPTVRWEYWNGEVWTPLPDLKGDAKVQAFQVSGEVSFTVPANLSLKQEFGQEKPWMRVVLVAGTFVIKDSGSATSSGKKVTFDKAFPPLILKFRLEYQYTAPAVAPKSCLSKSDFNWNDYTRAASFGSNPFVPFRHAEESRPTVYLGFTRALPTDLVSLFLNVKRNRPTHDLAWEYYDGQLWKRLLLDKDETNGLSQPGLVQFTWPGTPSLPDPVPVSAAEERTVTFLDPRQSSQYRPGDKIALFENDQSEVAEVDVSVQGNLTVTAPLQNKYTANAVAGRSPLARFGSPRHWVRIIWPSTTVPSKEDPDAVQFQGVYLNAVFAEHAKTVRDQIIGNTTGMSGETFDMPDHPVFEDEKVEILELEGRLAEAGSPLLEEELKKQGRSKSIALERDEKNGKISRVWVRWQERPSFAGAGPHDRFYVLDRTQGILQFGDGERGRIPPVLPNNLRVTYRSGGGKIGNVAPRTIRTVLNGATAAVVQNPVKAEGGADGEVLQTTGNQQYQLLLERGPQVIRHRYRALSPKDYEQLALAASPGVAAARVVTAVSTDGLVRAGAVKVVILPHTDLSDLQPLPSRKLKDQIREYLQASAPAMVANRVMVEDPQYSEIGVELVLSPKTATLSGILARIAPLSIRKFLHPVLGGLEGRGWPFGATIYRSDLIRFLHSDTTLYGETTLPECLAFVKVAQFLDRGSPVPEQMTVAPDSVPTAGPIRLVIDQAQEVCS